MDILKDPVAFIAKLLTDLLTGIGLPAPVVNVLMLILGVVVVASFCLLLPLFLIWFERRVVG